jgi:hypothetical protein
MALRKQRCPVCGHELEYRQIDLIDPFECPSCSKLLVVPNAYLKNSARIGLVLSLGLSVALAWINFFLIFLFPLFLLLSGFLGSLIGKRAWPPSVRPYAPSHEHDLSLFPRH